MSDQKAADANLTFGSAGTMLKGRYMAPPEDKDGKFWVRTSALIQASRDDLYAMWHDVESAPQWQEAIERVVCIGPTTSHWVMRSGDENR